MEKDPLSILLIKQICSLLSELQITDYQMKVTYLDFMQLQNDLYAIGVEPTFFENSLSIKWDNINLTFIK